MPNEELITGIKQHIANGDSKEAIRQHVTQAGYTEEEFEAAYSAAQDEEVVSASAPQTTEVTQGAQEQSSVDSFMAAQQQTGQSEASATPAGLPAVGSFLSEAFRFGLKRYDLVLWSILFQVVTLVAMGVAFGIGFLTMFTGLNPIVIVPVALVGFVAMIMLGTLNMGAILYATSSPTEVKYMEGFKWTWPRILPLILLYFGFSLTMMGGFLLLIVPGIIVMTSTCLAFFVFVREDLRGIKALDRSRQLVSGHGWPVFGRLVLLWLVLFVISIVGTIISAVIPVVGMLLQSFIGIFATIVAFRALASLYSALVIAKPEYVPGSTVGYRVLFWLGLLLIPIAILSSVVLASLNVAREKGQDAADMQRLTNMRAMAEIYANQDDGTVNYAGVCDEVGSVASGMDNFECADSAEAYAAEIELNEGYYCIDSSGYSEKDFLPVLVGTSCSPTDLMDLFGEESDFLELFEDEDAFDGIMEEDTDFPEFFEDEGASDGMIGELESARTELDEQISQQWIYNLTLMGMLYVFDEEGGDSASFAGVCTELQTFVDANGGIDGYACVETNDNFVVQTVSQSGYFCSDSNDFNDSTPLITVSEAECALAN